MIIGIGGSSRAGKTTLAEIVMWHFRTQNLRAIAIHQDDYVKPIHQIPLINGQTDWETPASIDFQLLKTSLEFHQQHFDVIILEGILTFANDEINKLFGQTFFVEISENTFKKRRRADKRWGTEQAWYLNHVWKSFLKYGQPPADLKNMVMLDGEIEYQAKDIIPYIPKTLISSYL